MPKGKPTGHKGGAVPPKGGDCHDNVYGVTYIQYVSRSNCQFVLDAQKEIAARINPSGCFYPKP